MRRVLHASGALLLVLGLALAGLANFTPTTDGWAFTVEVLLRPGQVEPGGRYLVATAEVPASLQGGACAVSGFSANGDSVHAENYAELTSANTVQLYGIEDEANGVHQVGSTLQLAATVDVWVVTPRRLPGEQPLGSSVRLEGTLQCTPPPGETTTSTVPETTSSTAVTTSSTVPEGTTTTVPPSTTSTVPEVTTTTVPPTTSTVPPTTVPPDTTTSTAPPVTSTVPPTTVPPPDTTSTSGPGTTSSTLPPVTTPTLPFTGPPVEAAGAAMAAVALLLLGGGVLLAAREDHA